MKDQYVITNNLPDGLHFFAGIGKISKTSKHGGFSIPGITWTKRLKNALRFDKTGAQSVKSSLLIDSPGAEVIALKRLKTP